MHMSWAEGFLLVYDVTNPETLDLLQNLKEKIEAARQRRSKQSSNKYAMVVVGNKSDLEVNCGWKVRHEFASEIASRIGAHSHVMCSARQSEESTIRFAFDELCREVVRIRSCNQNVSLGQRRRRSLAQVRQGLKMLVYTGKSKQNQTGSRNKSPQMKGETSSACNYNYKHLKKGNATIMSAPVVNSSQDHNIFLSLFNDSDYKKSREADFCN